MSEDLPLVFVVDDDADLREAIGELLREEGFRVAGLHDGRQALDLLKHGELPCVVLMDLRLPFMDAIEFRRRQLADPRIANVPVVLLSGHPSMEEELGDPGFSYLMRKPF